MAARKTAHRRAITVHLRLVAELGIAVCETAAAHVPKLIGISISERRKEKSSAQKHEIPLARDQEDYHLGYYAAS
jgi:hypothetical protein